MPIIAPYTPYHPDWLNPVPYNKFDPSRLTLADAVKFTIDPLTSGYLLTHGSKKLAFESIRNMLEYIERELGETPNE